MVLFSSPELKALTTFFVCLSVWKLQHIRFLFQIYWATRHACNTNFLGVRIVVWSKEQHPSRRNDNLDRSKNTVVSLIFMDINFCGSGKIHCFVDKFVDGNPDFFVFILRGCSMATSSLHSQNFTFSNYHLPCQKLGFFSINTFMCVLNQGAHTYFSKKYFGNKLEWV
jgi:hypothetical protein